MIHVIATIEIVPGKREDYLKLFRKRLPAVRSEKGCIAYAPTVDVEAGIPVQPPVRKDVVVIVETWESLDALKAHLATLPGAPGAEAMQALVKGAAVHVTKDA